MPGEYWMPVGFLTSSATYTFAMGHEDVDLILCIDKEISDIELTSATEIDSGTGYTPTAIVHPSADERAYDDDLIWEMVSGPDDVVCTGSGTADFRITDTGTKGGTIVLRATDRFYFANELMYSYAQEYAIKVDPAPPAPHTVRFMDGGTVLTSRTVADGAKVADIGKISRAGYRFDGWFNGNTKYDFDSPVTEDLTLKAKWTEAEFVESTATCTREGMAEHYETGTGDDVRYYTDQYMQNEVSAESLSRPALGHAYGEPSYTWTSSHSQVTAKATCARCRDTVTEVARGDAVTSEVTEPTCTEAGEVTFTAVFSGENGNIFDTVSETVAGASALGHSWGEATYTWADDNSKVTGRHSCTREGCGKTASETVDATPEVTRQATCEEPELTTWTSGAFAGEGFGVQTKEAETRAAEGHSWGEATYTWADDNSKVTGRHSCTREGCGKIESETVDATPEVTRQATCEESELTTWTSEAFTGEGFGVQTKEAETKAATGHSWSEATYTWADDNSKVTGRHSCTREGCGKIESETVDATPEVTRQATCEQPELTTWTSGAFNGEGFGVQTKEAETGAAAGHRWSEWTVTKRATETAEGEKIRTCSVCRTAERTAIPKADAAAPPTGKVTILNTIANSSKKTNDVIWDKSAVKGATNYEINWRARGAGKWASKTVGNTVRGTTTGLSIRGLYEIRVRPVKGAASTPTYTTSARYGAWSNTVYRYFHTTEKIKLASNSKGSFTMSWKSNPEATGYQVMFTTNKNGTGAANNINTVGRSATSFTKKGLKSGTTYYVQVREVRKVGTNSYIGNISCPVEVKVK